MSSAPSGLVPREGLVTLTYVIYGLHAFSAITGLTTSVLIVTAYATVDTAVTAIIA